jgi:ABC-type transport system involved in multi-copper enzyme maturation permease subunit
MFITLLIVTFVIALIVSFIVARVFSSPINNILKRIISDEISSAWAKYLKFAIYVVGISSGVRIWELEKYITPARNTDDATIIVLNLDRWILEVYRTIIGTLQGAAWLLLVFFIFALIAYVIVKISESRKMKEA